MEIVKSRYKGDDEILKIRPIGDLHLGHRNFREDVVKSALKTLNNSTRGLLMGDLLECATKTSIGKGVFDTNMNPQRQKEAIIELLRPFRQFIDGAVIGNHEERIVNDTSLDIMKDVCMALDIPYLHYTGIVKYAWNGVAYAIQIWHGAGGGAAAGTAIKKVEDMANRTFADVYCMGHDHKLITSDRIINVPDLRNMKVVPVKQHFVCTGSALDYGDGYAEMKGLQGRGLGFPTIELRGEKGNKDVKVLL